MMVAKKARVLYLSLTTYQHPVRFFSEISGPFHLQSPIRYPILPHVTFQQKCNKNVLVYAPIAWKVLGVLRKAYILV